MKKSKFTYEPMAFALRQAEGATWVGETCRKRWRERTSMPSLPRHYPPRFSTSDYLDWPALSFDCPCRQLIWRTHRQSNAPRLQGHPLPRSRRRLSRVRIETDTRRVCERQDTGSCRLPFTRGTKSPRVLGTSKRFWF